MEDLLESPEVSRRVRVDFSPRSVLADSPSLHSQDYGCYIVDRRSQSVEDSVEQLVSVAPLPIIRRSSH